MLFTDSFENQAAAAPWEEQVSGDLYAPNTRADKYVTTPAAHDGRYSAHYFARQGTNERTPIQFFADSSDFAAITGTAEDTTEIYFSWYEYFTSNYPFPSSSQKMLRIGYDNADFPAEKKEYDVLIQSSNADLNVQYFCGQWGDTSNCRIGDAIRSGTPMETDQWVKLGFWMKLNTPGGSDGFLRLYKNDQLFLERTNLDLRGSCSRGVNFLWLGGNYSNLEGGTDSRDGSRFIDDAEWWNTKP